MQSKEQRKRIEVVLSEPQNEVFASRASIIADIAGQGSGKTVVIGLAVGWMVLKFPEAKGFVGANTYEQLSSSTLSRIFLILEEVYGLTEYDKKENPGGHYVQGVKPPAHWKKSKYRFKSYNNIMTFWNGATVFLGSLDNYKVHDGKEFAWAHLDETKDTKKDALTTVILGRLRQYGLWVTPGGGVVWAPLATAEVAERLGYKAWNPCYIHTSPAEGNVDWLVELLGIAPFEKEIRETIQKEDDYFYRDIVAVDPVTKIETVTTVVIYSSYHNKENLPPGFIEGRKAKLSKSEILKFIYGYPFGRNGGEFFPGFARAQHVTKIEYNPALSIHTAWDFNAAPYITLLLCHVEYIQRWWHPEEKRKYTEKKEGCVPMEVLQFRFFKEYTIPDGTTELTADTFADDYEEFNPDIFANGDASGHSRIEGMGALTQYKIITNHWKNRFYLAEGWLRAKKVNIRVGKRRDLMNMIWDGRLPEVEVIMDMEHCPNLVRDCEYLLLDPKTGGKYKEEEKDKNGLKFQKVGHCADAMEYLVCELCKEFLKE